MSKFTAKVSYYREGSKTDNPVLASTTHTARVFADTFEEAVEKVKAFDPKFVGIFNCDMEELKNPTK